MNAHFVTRYECPGCGACATTTIFFRPYADPALRRALEAFYAAVGRLEYEALLGANYIIQACGDCGLLFQRDVPDDYLLEQLYERWISPEQAFERFHARVSPVREHEIRGEVMLSLALVREVALRPRVLDYGCGWGEWARATAGFGAEPWGTELSAARRIACEQAGIRIVSDAELPDHGFDMINADQVFEHLPAPTATLALLKGKLRAGGVIRIAVPNGWRVKRALKAFDRELQRPRLGRINPIAPLEHLNCFKTSSLVRLAERSGLARVRPNWRVLRGAFVWPPGLRGKLKQTILPFYLRSGWTTQLWFTHAIPS